MSQLVDEKAGFAGLLSRAAAASDRRNEWWPGRGKVDWHPSILDEARKTGLSVDDEGNLIIEKRAA
jgi:hypothetical protein